ncbi:MULTISPECIES: phage tail assembly protein [Aeromonas]|uniref:Phage tail assembly protein n=1 Tax=Aeromonas hydrophila TaxID=644 RepID=A0AAX3P726_AERHY|nr:MULTISPECIES: phage tail assembly protein [Aeromonas]MCJ8215467.1 phage tail assembly protein [Aeromonas veronii]TNI42139.1 phage tail protein [Aeromonas veronii]WEE25251.1 phage tail assembly protein [Aeromonas hydrophila]
MENKTVTLDQAIQRGDTTITEIQLRKPKAGEMRGLNMTDVVQMDVNALTKLLPRITTPILTEAEIGNMDPADLMQLGSEVSTFLVPKKMAYLIA